MPNSSKSNKKAPHVTLRDLARVVDELFPEALAETWDNVGLQLGDPAQALRRVIVCLEVTDATLAEARRKKADAILAHHPLIFKPWKAIREDAPTQRLAAGLIRAGMGLVVAHTNMDSAAWGTNQILADLAGVTPEAPLEPRVLPRGPVLEYKLIVFTPQGHENAIIEAIHRGGGGRIGLYTHCTFRTPGVGTFIGGEGTRPAVGQAGRFEEASEYRLESIVPVAARERVIEAIRAAHPYEEPAYDLVPLAEPVGADRVGLGCVGSLAAAQSVDRFVGGLRRRLKIKSARVSGPGNREIRRVAICTGSGGSLLSRAAACGADAFLTGEVNYHAGVEAHQRGITVIEIGHFESEVIMSGPVANKLATHQRMKDRGISFFAAQDDFQPFSY